MFNIKKHMRRQALIFAVLFLGLNTAALSREAPKPASSLGFKVVRVLPHNPTHYTQGLVFYKGKLLESTGQYGLSGLHEIDLNSGKILRSRKLEPQFFGEGLAIARGHIVQLTWREQTAFVYDLSLKPIKTFHYASEGWGLASIHQEQELVMSDGTPTLRFIDADNYRFLRQITVRDGDQEIMRLNELETVKGLIYANVWLTDTIAVIDATNGRVVNWVDLSALQLMFKRTEAWSDVDNVLNGIAYNPNSGHFYVTGKRWPVLFEIQIESPQRPH